MSVVHGKRGFKVKTRNLDVPNINGIEKGTRRRKDDRVNNWLYFDRGFLSIIFR
jgi:hypothetical protein